MLKAIFVIIAGILIFLGATELYYGWKNHRQKENVAAVVNFVTSVQTQRSVTAEEIIIISKISGDEKIIAEAAKELRLTETQVAQYIDFEDNIYFLAKRKLY